MVQTFFYGDVNDIQRNVTDIHAITVLCSCNPTLCKIKPNYKTDYCMSEQILLQVTPILMSPCSENKERAMKWVEGTTFGHFIGGMVSKLGQCKLA